MVTKIFKLVFFFFLFFNSISTQGQQNKIDSILTLLKTDREDTNKVRHLNDLGWELKNSNPDTAIILYNQALAMANSLPNGWGRAEAVTSLGQLGVSFRLKADYPKALDYFFKALKMAEALGDKRRIAIQLGNIGNVYKEQGDYPKALDYYLKALKFLEALGDKNGIARQLSNIGVVYKNQTNYPQALDYYLKALKTFKELGDKNKIAAVLSNIGVIYKEQADYPKALDYLFKALKIAEELGDKNKIATIFSNIGSLYTDMIASAYDSEKGALTDKAEQYLLDAIDLDKEMGAQDGERQDEELISNLYTKTNRYELALEHYKKAMVLKDTLFSAEKNKELTRKEMNYTFEKKEAATKAEQNKKDTVTQIIIYSVSAGFALVLLLAVFIFRGYRQKQKANKMISFQKLLVEEKQKDILDSIHYARRIQRSLLPTEKYIHKKLTELNKLNG